MTETTQSRWEGGVFHGAGGGGGVPRAQQLCLCAWSQAQGIWAGPGCWQPGKLHVGRNCPLGSI